VCSPAFEQFAGVVEFRLIYFAWSVLAKELNGVWSEPTSHTVPTTVQANNTYTATVFICETARDQWSEVES
jgi:hypothetical protein